MIFTFFCRNYFENNGNNIFTEKHYESLLDFCFLYGFCFSVTKTENNSCYKQIERWRMENIPHVLSEAMMAENRKLYLCCEATKQFLVDNFRGLFDMDSLNPEDIEFYREDYTVLMDTISHEGECSIYPEEGESFDAVISIGGWLEMTENFVPSVYASEYQYSIRTDWRMLEDPLYLYLRSVQSVFESKVKSIEDLARDIEKFCADLLHLPKGERLPYGASCFPSWYYAFNMYILGEYQEKTNTRMTDVLLKHAGRENSVIAFYKLLDSFEKRVYEQLI